MSAFWTSLRLRWSGARKTEILCVGVVVAVALIPCYLSRGSLLIGGDTILPFWSDGIARYLSPWIEVHNGVYMPHNYAPYYLFCLVFDRLPIDLYARAGILMAALNLIGALGVYKLARLLYGDIRPIVGAAAACFYVLSPAHYNAWPYLQVYACNPWLLYVVAKTIKARRITYADVLSFSGLVFWGAVDLPNPKYLFYLFMVMATCYGAALASRAIHFRFFARNAGRILLLAGVSTYLVGPLVYFGLHYRAADYGVTVKAGYTDRADAVMMDQGVATMDRMMRLFHDGVVFAPPLRARYFSSVAVCLAGYFPLALIGLYFLKNGRPRRADTILACLMLVFLLFAVGPNAPLGALYRFAVARFGALAFLRTTAGAIFYLSLFYSLLLVGALEYFNSGVVTSAFVACLALASYPLLNGDYYRNWSPVNTYLNTRGYGLRVPDYYFAMKPDLDAKKLDARVYVPNTDLSYVNLRWGFFGPAAFYFFLYDAYMVGTDGIGTNWAAHNVGYVLHDRSLDVPNKDPRALSNFPGPGIKSGFLELRPVPAVEFRPRIHARAGRGVAPPILEYKRIGRAKYRVLAHRVQGDWTLVLAEQYHDLWRLYVGDRRLSPRPANAALSTDGYRVFPGNEAEQAGPEQLRAYVAQGWITTLGDRKPREAARYSYTGAVRRRAGAFRYLIDFVSRDNAGTIQNDNLRDGPVWETAFLRRPMGAIHHRVDDYANAWAIRAGEVRRSFPSSIALNEDGSYDVEFVVEFFPQIVFDACLGGTAASLLVLLSLMAFGARPPGARRRIGRPI